LADLKLVAEGLRALFTVYGFGAKTSSGFGLAQETVKEGTLSLRAEPPPPEATPAPTQDLPRYLEAPNRLKPAYRNPDGSFRYLSEVELKTMKKADRQLYDKAKAWWEREGKALAESAVEPKSETPAMPAAPETTWPSWPFVTFDELATLANQVAQQVRKGDIQ
jgi:CRISPR-associated protein Cmr2